MRVPASDEQRRSARSSAITDAAIRQPARRVDLLPTSPTRDRDQVPRRRQTSAALATAASAHIRLDRPNAPVAGRRSRSRESPRAPRESSVIATGTAIARAQADYSARQRTAWIDSHAHGAAPALQCARATPRRGQARMHGTERRRRRAASSKPSTPNSGTKQTPSPSADDATARARSTADVGRVIAQSLL